MHISHSFFVSSVFYAVRFLIAFSLAYDEIFIFETPTELTDINGLTQLEICEAVCLTPTGTRTYFAYEAEMLVLRHVFKGFSLLKLILEKMIEDRSYYNTLGQTHFEKLNAAVGELTYAYEGVDTTFLTKFDPIAKQAGLESPAHLESQIMVLRVDISRLQKNWLADFSKYSKKQVLKAAVTTMIW